MRGGRYNLWIVLALALALRLAPMLYERQAGDDAVANISLAESLRAGRGFFLDVKSLGFMNTPVVHYGGTEQPVLLPVLLSLLRRIAPPFTAAQMIEPLLFLAALGFAHQALRRTIGPGAALAAGLLLAVHPALFDVSLQPVAQTAGLFAAGLIVWTFIGTNSPMLTGLACTVGALAEPGLLLATGALLIVYLIRSVHRREGGEALRFAAFAAVGPVWLMVFNRAMGAPLLTLPQGYLFRLTNLGDAIHYLHRGAVYDNPLAVWRAHGREVAGAVGRNALSGARILFSTRGLGLLVPLLPVAVAGLSQARELRRFGWLGAIALALGALAVLEWAGFSGERDWAIPIYLMIVLIAVGSHEVLDREPLWRWPGSWSSAAALSMLAVAVVWFGMDAWRAGGALLEWRRGRGVAVSGDVAALWQTDGADEIAARFRQEKFPIDPRNPYGPIVATNVPWMLRARTALPAVILPYDLDSAEWAGYLARNQAEFVAVDLAEWPKENDRQLSELLEALGKGGWRPWFGTGEFQVWRKSGGGGSDGGGKGVNPTSGDPMLDKEKQINRET